MDKSAIKKGIFDVLRGIIFSLLFSMILVLVVSVIAKYTAMSDKVATALNQIIKVVALFAGVTVGFRQSKWGLVKGLICGVLFTLTSFGVFSLISGDLDFGQITVFDFLLGGIAGLASGVIAVNLRSLKANRQPRRRAKAGAKA